MSSIKEKIQKLLALAGNNPNEHERAEALARAQQLMLEHDLTESQIGSPDVKDVINFKSKIRAEKWQRYVCYASAMLYDCKSYYVQNGFVFFLGFPQYVDVAVDIATWLIAGIDTEAKTFRREHRNSFKLGAAVALHQKAKELKETPEMVSSPNQLMRISTVEQVYNSMENMQQSKARKSTVTSAFDFGVNYGKNVNLNKQVSASAVKRIESK